VDSKELQAPLYTLFPRYRCQLSRFISASGINSWERKIDQRERDPSSPVVIMKIIAVKEKNYLEI